MTAEVLLLVAGLAALIKGGDWFVASAVRLAAVLRLPTVLVGSTIVSLATTTPEFVVAITAGASDTSSLALGNAVGSCVCNIGLIVGVAATMRGVDIGSGTLRPALAAMVTLAVILWILSYDLWLLRWEGLLLIMVGVGYFAGDLIAGARSRSRVEMAQGQTMEAAVTGRHSWLRTRAGTVTQFALAAGLVIVASRVVVDSAVELAERVGISPMVIGLTVVAVATSLPELATAIGAARRNVAELAIGNIVGANIANLTFILGAAAVLSPVGMTRLTQQFDFPAMLALMALFVWVLWTRHRLTRGEGAMLLAAYAGYIAGVIVLSGPD
jgi:cation:H+ antiporter